MFKRVFDKMEHTLYLECGLLDYLAKNSESAMIRYVLEKWSWKVSMAYDIIVIVNDLCEQDKPDLEVIEHFCGSEFDKRREITYKCMDNAAAQNAMDIVQYLADSRSEGCSSNAMDLAASQGHLAMVTYLHTTRSEGCTFKAIDLAAKGGYLDIVMYLSTERTEGCTERAIDYAAENGHLSVVQYLNDHRTEGCTERAMNTAAANGHLDVVQYLHEQRKEGCTTLAMDKAAAHGYLSMVQFLHTRRTEGCTTEAIDMAAICGDINMVTFLSTNRSEGCTQTALDMAACFGGLHKDKTVNTIVTRAHGDSNRLKFEEVMAYLGTHRTEGHSKEMLTSMAYGNSLFPVTMLDDDVTRYRWDEAFKQSCEMGNEPFTRYLVEHQHPHVIASINNVIREALKNACLYDSLEIVKMVLPRFQQVHPSFPTDKLLRWAVGEGCIDIARYLIDTLQIKPAEQDDSQRNIVGLAMVTCGKTFVKHLVETLGFKPPVNIHPETGCTDLPYIEYLVSLGCCITRDFIDTVILNGLLRVLEYIYPLQVDYKGIKDDTKYITSALQGQHLHILQYLLAQKYGSKPLLEDFTIVMDIALNKGFSPSCIRTALDAVQDEAKERSVIIRTATHRLSILDLEARGYSNLKYCSYLHEEQDELLDEQLIQGDPVLGTPTISGQLKNLILNYPYLMKSRDIKHDYVGLRDKFLKILAGMDNMIVLYEWDVNASPLSWIAPQLTAPNVFGLVYHGISLKAIEIGDLTLMQYLRDNHYDGYTDEMDLAAEQGDLEMVKFLHHSVAIDCSQNAMDYAASNGFLSVVKFLHTNRSEGCTTEAMDCAAESGFLTVIQYLHANRSEGCTQQALQNAVDGGHYSTIQFLLANRREGHSKEMLTFMAYGKSLFPVTMLDDDITRYDWGEALKEGSEPFTRYLIEHQHPHVIASVNNVIQEDGQCLPIR
eukprot:gene17189-20481_t